MGISGRARLCLLVAACGIACADAAWAQAQTQAQAQDASVTPLAAIDRIRGLTPESAERKQRVAIRGTITYLNEREPAGLIVHDGNAAIFVHYGREHYLRTHPRLDLHPGDVIDVDGHTTGEGFAPAVVPDAIRRVGHASLPPAKHVSYAALLSGVFDCEYIELVGVGHRAWLSESGKTLFLDVAVEGGMVRAWFWDFTPGDVTRFIDARVRLVGNAGTLFNQARQVRGVTLFASRTTAAVIETSAPEPWSLPMRTLSSLYTHQAGDQLDRRVRVQGTVIGTRVGQPTLVEDITMRSRSRDVRHHIYVQDQMSAAMVETEQPFDLNAGDLVDIAGFPIVSATKPSLQNAVVRRIRPGVTPPPRDLGPASLLAASQDSALVRIEAVLLAEVTTPAGRSLILKAGDTVFEADHDPRSTATTTGASNGTLVSVTGIYVFESGPPPSFRVLLRSPADIAVLASPPWWTARHSIVLGAIVLVMGLAGLVWARVVAQRNALVSQQYRAIIAERSRLAAELHDTLEQGLTGIRLQLGAVAKTLDSSPPAARRALGIASEMLRYCLGETRRAVMDLRPGALETRDLAGALSDVARQMTIGTSLHATVRTIGAARPLESADEHHLLRIGLEALTNAIKHSGASHVDVALRFDDQAVHLVVTDDGTGFVDTRLDRLSGHFGLRGIRERVDKIGGSLTLENDPKGGAVVAVRVPVTRQADPRSEVGQGSGLGGAS